MKKIYNYICAGLVGVSALCLVACNNDAYLTVDHTSILSDTYMFQSEKNIEAGLIGIYDTFYPTKSNLDADDASMWGFKPQFMLANHPTLDTQASGWDAAYCTESWTSTSSEFLSTWQGHYRAIARCNLFLAGLETMDVSLFANGDAGKKQLEAEARAIRAWNYFNLVKNFGRVPMLNTGENYVNTPSKPRPATDAESWALINSDLTYAAGILDWTPRKGQYGRMTKGFCLGYEAEALMFQGKYADAKSLLKSIIDSKTYSLVPCYSQLYDIDKAWTKEDIWCVVMYTDNGNNRSGVSGWSPTEDNYQWACYNTASMEYNGWGSLFISWECYNSFEVGDKRRQASMVALGETNPWTKQKIGANGAPHVKTGSEFMPNISSVKYWRTTNDYWSTINAPFTEHYLRYSNILLDYAECCFQTNTDAAAAWSAIDEVRNRAWGNLEAANNLATSNPTYPIPMNTTIVTVPDAQAYYTTLYASKGYTSVNTGVFACNWERRHENNAEFNLFYDLKRSGMLHEFLNKEYPANTGTASNAAGAIDDWHTYRTFVVNDNKFLYPIPNDEIVRNSAITPADQNPGY
jgi:SusD family.